MRIHEVSVLVRDGMAVAPGNPPVQLESVTSEPGGSTKFGIRLAAHAGTHVDVLAPDGAAALPLDALVGPAVVVDGTGSDGDLGAEIELPDGAERLLFRTRNSAADVWARDHYVEDSVELSPELARRLIAAGARLVGIDYLTIGGEEVHRVLLEAGVVVLEGLDLQDIEPGAYQLVCLPLRLVGADGAPARAILLEDV